ncbi:AraC family transcriptional regulator [Fulvivirga maritima]|uniref:AraC family transcriptional regulator n=1 Tax=Fulvivirga maritima TaxID=2904247 RepID=UPI001F1BA8E1|nr:helix-turn-helix domain-containing protein [Fulvivirga maritima]UII28284.1 AraC family transcriptional regulator [Fulvivirga maritima]
MDRSVIYTKSTDIEQLNMDMHAHEHHHQLIYIVKGTLHIRVDDMQYFLPEGFIGLIPAAKHHSLHSRNEMVKMFLTYFPTSISLDGFMVLNSNDFIIENIRYISKQPNSISPLVDKPLYNYIYSFLELLKTAENQQAYPIKGLIAPKNERLAQVLNYLEKNFKEDITLSSVADSFGFSTRNLTRLFKKENISFNNYLHYIRIIHAIELFTEHQENIEQVAYEVGYNTASNFSRTFKKYTGQSPKSFIKANSTVGIFK